MYIYMYTYVCVYIYIHTLYLYTHAYIHVRIHIHVCFHTGLTSDADLSQHIPSPRCFKALNELIHVVDSDRRRGLEILLTCWSCLKMSEKTQYLIVRNRFSWFFPYETAMVEGFSGRCFHRPEVTIKTVLKGPKTGLTSDWLNITSQPHI